MYHGAQDNRLQPETHVIASAAYAELTCKPTQDVDIQSNALPDAGTLHLHSNWLVAFAQDSLVYLQYTIAGVKT